MKISELTLPIIKDYVGTSGTDSDTTLALLLGGVKSFVMGQVGLTAEQLDLHEDLTIAVIVLVDEMYTNRQMSVEKASQNPTVTQIMAMYATNLLCTPPVEVII